MRQGQGKARSMALRTLKRLSILLFFVSSANLSAWESQLFSYDSGYGIYYDTPVTFSGRTWQLLDYSYVGYKLGTQPLATGVPCTVFPVSGSGDITAALQTAINSAQASGGIVRIPAGTFTLSSPLYITGNNVSIEGAGSNATFLNVPSTYTQSDPRYEGLFTFGKGAGGWNKGWIDRGTVLTDVTGTVKERQIYIDVADGSVINVGDWITVRQYFWPGLSNPNSSGTWPSYSGWPANPNTDANRSYSFTYLRQVSSKYGVRIELDAPIPWRLDPANNPIKVQRVMPTGGFSMRENVGLSGVNIRFADNQNDTSYSPARPAGAAVHFEGVRDGWVYDTVIHNFPRFAIQGESAARITVLDTQVYDCQDDGGDGFGYGFHWNESQQILVKRCYVESVRHAYISQHPLSSFIVFTQNQSREARQGDDAHHSFVHGYLFDDHHSYGGSGARMEQRGSTSGNAYECLGNGVFWNFQGDDGRGGGADGGSIFMNPSPQGWGMVIGGPGGAYKVFDGDTAAGDLIPPSAGLQVGPTLDTPGLGSKDQNALYEGIGQSGLTPASLYEAQWLRRMGVPHADYASTCSASFNRYPITPSSDSGPGTLIYDSDHLGWVPQLGGACDPSSTAAGGTHTIQCWADSPTRDHTSGSGESALITVNGVNWNILMSFTGPSQPRNTYTSISFWAYSSQANVQLHFDVAQREDGTYNDLNDASTLITIPVANSWTQVTVPMSSYGSGATLFNKIQISSASTNAGATVYLDDMRLNGAATPSPTMTPSRTGSMTPSQTPSSTASASPSASPSKTATASPSPSLTATQTASPSRTATRTPSPAASATPSPSPTSVSGIQIEAEGGVLNGTNVASSHAGYSAGGYVDGFDTAGDSCTVTYNAPTAGLYELSLRYSSPSGDKPNDLRVNGSLQGTVTFVSSAGWANTAPVLVYLNAGANTLSILNNWGYIQLDRFDLDVASTPLVLPHASLVTVSPSAEAAGLMCYLASQYGQKIITGQAEGTSDTAWLNSNTGHYPALAGFDMIDYSPSRVAHGSSSTAVEQALAWAAAGGIVQFQWHWNAPDGLIDTPGHEWWRGFYTDSTTYDLAYALANTSSPEYLDLIRDLDAIAVQLKRLRDAGVPVLWRPLHEAEGGWFWWGAKGSTAYKQLYQLMFQRFTQVDGLNNLIWVWTSGTDAAAATWYPGDASVDIVGPDIYGPDQDYGPLTSTFYSMVQAYPNKMVALTENGNIPDPALMQAQGAKWLYFMTWNGYENDPTKNSLAHVQSVYTHSYALTRDELPFPVACPGASTATPTASPSVTQTRTPSPTLTPSATPSASPSPTPTGTWGAEKQLDAFKATSQLYSSYQPAAAGGSLSLNIDSSAGNYTEGSEALRVDASFNAAAGFAEVLRGYGTQTLDLSLSPYGLSFWIKGSVSTDTVRLMLYEDQSMDGSPYDAGDEVWASPPVPIPTTWTKMVVPYSAFSLYAGSGNGSLDLNRIEAWRIALGNGTGTAHGAQVWIDDLRQLTTRTAAADNAAVLNGSFIQLWNTGTGCACGAWTQPQWDAELQKLKDLCQDTVYVQYGAWEDNAWYAPEGQSFLNYSNPTLGRIFSAAESLGMKVVVGLWFGESWNTDDKTLAATYSTPLNRSTAVAGEIAALYGSSAAFGGWYIPQEVEDLSWPTGSAQLTLLRNFLRDTAAAAKAAKNAPVYLSPYFGPNRPADDLQAWWDGTLAVATGIDVLIPQDGVGTTRVDGDVDVPQYMAAIKAAALGRGRSFGINVENFQQTSGWPVNGAAFAAVPADITRFKSQLWEAKAAGASTIVQFEYPYMQSSLGAAQTQLYNDYKTYQSTEAPCGASPTPTRSPTGSFSPSPSLTRTPSASPSATATATATLSASPSASRTATAAPSPSPSPSLSPSASPTWTAGASPSPTPAASATPSPSPAATAVHTGQLIYSSNAGGSYQLYRLDLSAGPPQQLTTGAFNDLNPQVSPDGRYAVFYSDRDGDQEIWRLDLTDLSLTQLTFNTASDYDPSWSPDGTKIVFKSNRDDGLGDIFVMNADGSGQTNVTPGRSTVEDWDPTFSQDGSQIYFVSRLTAGDPNSDEIFVMDANGANVVRLTNNSVPDWYPAVNPADGSLAFVSKSAPASDDDIFVMQANGSGRTQLTSGNGDDGDPAWSLDGSRLATVNSSSGFYDLWLMNADGSGANGVISLPGSTELGPAWCPPLTPTVTKTSTPSATPSVTPSGTVTRSATASVTLTRSPSLTQSPMATATLTATRSATPTPSPSLTVTAVSPTVTETFTSQASVTASPAPSGPLTILGQVPLPNPNPVELRVWLGSAAESVRTRYYSPAMILLADEHSGPRPQGWSAIAVPAGLPHGLVYAVLEARQGERHSLPVAPLRLYFIP